MKRIRKRDGVVYRETPEKDIEIDLYQPDGVGDAPVVMLIHGGGWKSDNHGMYEKHLTRLAERGYAGADVTHRLSCDAPFPTPVKDIKYAIRWLKSNADEYRFDPDRIAIGGISSGAHLAALAAVSASHPDLAPERAPDESARVAAVLAMNGLFNIEKLGQMDPSRLFISGAIRRLFGAEYLQRPNAYRLASCLTHIDGSEPPFLVMTGTNDQEVPPYESVQLRDQLEHAGARTEFYIADGGDHFCFTQDETHYEEGMERIESFLDEYL